MGASRRILQVLLLAQLGRRPPPGQAIPVLVLGGLGRQHTVSPRHKGGGHLPAPKVRIRKVGDRLLPDPALWGALRSVQGQGTHGSGRDTLFWILREGSYPGDLSRISWLSG